MVEGTKKPLGEALLDLFAEYGSGLLNDPRRLLSFVMDYARMTEREKNAIGTALKDSYYLAYFSDAVQKEKLEAIEGAALKGSKLLNDSYAMEMELAQNISRMLATAVAKGSDIDVPSGYEFLSSQNSGFTVKSTLSGQDSDSAETEVLEEAMTAHTSSVSSNSSPGPIAYNDSSQNDGSQSVDASVRNTSEPGGNTQSFIATELPNVQTTGTSGVSNRNDTSKVWIIAIAGLIVVAVVVIVMVLMGALSPKDTGQSEQHGWASATEGPTTGAAKTEVTLSFDANGADGGEPPANISFAKGGSVTLPDAGSLTRQGYKFAGWGESKSARTLYEAGATFVAITDTKLYAIWDLLVELSSEFDVTTESYRTDTNGFASVLKVKNNSKYTVDLDATFKYTNASGNVVDTQLDKAWSVGPGEVTLLMGETDKVETSGSSYSIAASTPVLGSKSIMSFVEVSIVSKNADGATVEIRNKGNEPVWLKFCTLYGRDAGQNWAYRTNAFDTQDEEVAPGKTVTTKFPGGYWAALNNEVYLFGYAGKY